jgi:hypothetical protein
MFRHGADDRLGGVRNHSRRRFVQTIGVTGLGLAAGTGLATGTTGVAEDEGERERTGEDADGSATSNDDGPTEIDSPTVIDEPGEYELVADLRPDSLDRDACLVIDSDGVTVRGNGHTIDLHNVDRESEPGFSRAGNRIGIAVNPDPDEEMAADGWQTAVSDLTVRGASTGILSWISGRTEFEDVTLTENGFGYYAYVAEGVLDNCVVSANETGVRLDGSLAVFGGSILRMADSTVESNDKHGIIAVNASSAGLERSRLVANGAGIMSGEYSAAGLSDCHICRNDEYGVLAALMIGDESHPSAQGGAGATDCYWGAANGPSSIGDPDQPYADPETGRLADGDGDAISESLESGLSNVRFDPFREAPIDDVGADL